MEGGTQEGRERESKREREKERERKRERESKSKRERENSQNAKVVPIFVAASGRAQVSKPSPVKISYLESNVN